jgi:hypothetical protein
MALATVLILMCAFITGHWFLGSVLMLLILSQIFDKVAE